MASKLQKNATERIPWYKEKLARSEYLKKGDPQSLMIQDLKGLVGWREIDPQKYAMWKEARSVVDQKNKKREYKITYDDPPIETEDGYKLSIEILHRDYQGFNFTAVHPDLSTLEMTFWPVIEQLLAVFFSPRLATRPVPLPELRDN